MSKIKYDDDGNNDDHEVEDDDHIDNDFFVAGSSSIQLQRRGFWMCSCRGEAGCCMGYIEYVLLYRQKFIYIYIQRYR